MGSGERQRAHRARIHRNRHRGGRGRPRLALDRGSRDRGFDTGAGAVGERLQRATGIRRACCPGRHGLEARIERPAALDHPRFHPSARYRRSRHRLARGRSARGFSGSRIEHRQAVDARPRCRPCGGRSQLRLLAGPQGEIPAPRSVESLHGRDSAHAVFRVLALDRCVLVRRREGRATRLASTLAASRAERVDADRPFERNAVRTDEHRRHGGGGRGVVLARTHAEDRRGTRHLGGRGVLACTRGALGARALGVMGDRAMASDGEGASRRGRRSAHKLSPREPHRAAAGRSSPRRGAPVPGHASVAAVPQCRGRQPDSRPRMGREGAARERCAQCGRDANAALNARPHRRCRRPIRRVVIRRWVRSVAAEFRRIGRRGRGAR